ncbi:hypothetical protein SM124_01440 [Bacillus sp. 31A1R]|uniref:Uncharacterized protein n=1 Tax=Robertmurraya mangrovi TaxID=3098077 RepID=A0ABU5ITD7_9BACI|nr:hypothetical protein [Bacillus sp. 31A1R]MDZ5470401.1 hypothetical protein [Bacillus sp. 31A1R]
MECKNCNREMALIIEEDGYRQWECRGIDQFETDENCGTYLEQREENGWKKEWRKTKDR